MEEFNEKMKSSKNIPFDKKHIIIEKETFDSMNKIIKETEKSLSLQPKIDNLFNQMSEFTQSHQTLQKENDSMKKEIDNLKYNNRRLNEKNRSLRNQLKTILEGIKDFFRKLLQIGHERIKELATDEIKGCYDLKYFDSDDVYDVAVDTTKEDELFDYVGIEKENEFNNTKKSKDDDFDLSL